MKQMNARRRCSCLDRASLRALGTAREVSTYLRALTPATRAVASETSTASPNRISQGAPGHITCNSTCAARAARLESSHSLRARASPATSPEFGSDAVAKATRANAHQRSAQHDRTSRTGTPTNKACRSRRQQQHRRRRGWQRRESEERKHGRRQQQQQQQRSLVRARWRRRRERAHAGAGEKANTAGQGG